MSLHGIVLQVFHDEAEGPEFLQQRRDGQSDVMLELAVSVQVLAGKVLAAQVRHLLHQVAQTPHQNWFARRRSRQDEVGGI